MKTTTSARRSERGEGSWGNIVRMGISAILALMAYNAWPVISKNNALQDKIQEIATGFPIGEKGNVLAREALARAITELELTEFIPEDACSVTSQGGMGGTRTVTCKYTRKLTLFPGIVRSYTFNPSKSAPML